MHEIAHRTGWAPLGLLPHFEDAQKLPAEDALGLIAPRRLKGAKTRIAVPILPHIANFDDLDPLDAEPDVDVIRVRLGAALPGDADLILLPGSKATIADLAAVRKAGFHIDLLAHVRRGGRVLGLCGGYQMLGRRIADPDGIEGPAGTAEGLGLLDVETVLTGDKRLVEVQGTTVDGIPVRGYEMHMGVTEGPDRSRPFATIAGEPEGATAPSGRIAGTYLHGLFAADGQRSAWLERLGGAPSPLDYEAGVDAALDALAAHLEAHLDLNRILEIAR